MREIRRLNLPVEDKQYVEVTGRIISVAPDRGGSPDHFDLWFEHDDEVAPVEAKIVVLGTGHPVPWDKWTRHAYEHVGTIITLSGRLVWHVYRGPNKGQVVGL